MNWKKDVTIHGHLVYFEVIRCNLWLIGVPYGHSMCFSRFGILYQEQSGNTELDTLERVEGWSFWTA
jgi:hypothetical protein